MVYILKRELGITRCGLVCSLEDFINFIKTGKN